MRPVLDTSNEAVWASLENATPHYDLLSRKPKNPLFWAPRFSFIPVRSIFEYPVIAENELGELNRTIEYNCHLFNTSSPEDVRLLCVIKDRIYSNWYVQVDEQTKWDDNNNLLIWLTWAQQYLESPRTSINTDTND